MLKADFVVWTDSTGKTLRKEPLNHSVHTAVNSKPPVIEVSLPDGPGYLRTCVWIDLESLLKDLKNLGVIKDFTLR